MNMQIRTIKTEDVERIETGPLQVNDDWPGVFIRGDNAMGYKMYLKIIKETHPEADCMGVISGLIDLFSSCIHQPCEKQMNHFKPGDTFPDGSVVIEARHIIDGNKGVLLVHNPHDTYPYATWHYELNAKEEIEKRCFTELSDAQNDYDER